MLEVRLFGTGQALFDELPLPGFPSQRPSLLLCYLLLNRDQSHSREQLAALFWGEYPTPVSRKYLRNALWRIKGSLQTVGASADRYLTIGNDTVSFTRTGRYWLDVEAFETTTTLYRHLSGRELSATLALQLEEVVDLYTGDLLQGIYEDWCLFERERLNLLYLDTLGKLIIFHEFRGTYEQGLNYGNRILAFDNTREAVHRHLMRLHWLLGDRNAALVQYKRCVQILRETLNVPPTEVTARLYQQILHDQPATDRSNALRAGLAAADWRDEDAQALLEHACRRLHHLQATLDETGSELQHISRLMSAVQDRWEDANRPAERRSEDVA